EELTGRPKQALIGTPHKNLYPSVEHADYEALVFRLAHVGEMLFHGIRLRHPDGHTIPAEFSAKNVEWSGKQAAQVTFRTLNNSASEHEIRFFQNALESLLEGICLTDLDNRLLFVNTEFQTIFGYESEEVLGKPMDFILSAQDQLDIKQDPRFTFLEEDIWTGEITARRKDGTSFPANLSKSTIQNNSEIPLGSIYIVKNISEKKRLEEEMVRTEKLRGLSTLAGGIAHDFNNILTAVLGNLSLARLYEDDPEKMQTILERTEQAARRATGLTTQLLTFSKGGQPIQKQVKVRNLLRGVLDFTLSGSNVNYRLQLSKNLYPVSIDMDQMNQALHNIILNAVQAMPKGGTITVTAENKIIDKSNRLPGLEGRYYVQIRFTDQGPGISESDLPKVFDPFFTTKTTGSGLGLATTYSIVRRHKGTVSIESFNDRGTTVVLYLPAVITAEEEPMVSEDRRIPRSKGRVLVMDDEKGIREVCTEFLKYMGFEAVEAADGESAFQIYKEAYQGGKPFDAVIMDLTVPGGMGGQETIRRLREFDDKVRAIVSSGYSTSPVMANYQEYGFQGVVSKPYQLEDLKQVLEQVLS
ncbi:MAG: PAS domain S-box protein, partial [Calditrichota bacterium]